MNISTQVSWGDIFVGLGLLAAMAQNYFGTQAAIKELRRDYEEVRRGRGLILEHFPHAVQRCFGFINGGTNAR